MLGIRAFVFVFLLIFSIIIIQPAFADEDTIISIIIIGESEFYLDSDNKMIRAKVVIENFDPGDGYYFMRVSDSSGNVVKETEILPKNKGNEIWGTEFAHIITNEVPETFQILIYTEFGTATATETISLLETKPIVQQAVKEEAQETESVPEPEPEVIEEPTQKLPDWVRNIFIWYAEEQISEDELIGALQFLIQEEIIQV